MRARSRPSPAGRCNLRYSPARTTRTKRGCATLDRCTFWLGHRARTHSPTGRQLPQRQKAGRLARWFVRCRERSMSADPLDLTLELAPRARFEIVELRSRFAAEHRETLGPYPNCLYWSAHTTAGFLERSLISRLSPAGVSTYLEAFRTMFPEGAGYEHDRLE